MQKSLFAIKIKVKFPLLRNTPKAAIEIQERVVVDTPKQEKIRQSTNGHVGNSKIQTEIVPFEFLPYSN